jgi:hypothetical protein
MHSSKDIRQVKCFDGLHYSFEFLKYNYSLLYESCVGIRNDQKNIISALSQCWSFIDAVHRIREIVQALPGLSKNSNELKRFLKTTEIAEAYRHYIQHLRGELSKKEINSFPVWGSLGWVDLDDPDRSYLVIIGAQIERTSHSGCVFDKWAGKWVSKVCLGVDGKSFNFDPIYEECMKFREFIMPWITSNYEPGIKVTEKLTVISMKIILRKNV